MTREEGTMSAMTPVPADHPLMKAWNAYLETEAYRNAAEWARQSRHIEGSLWAAFERGWRAATERAAMLHESINVACDHERQAGHPGAGAMGAVVQYRDEIRAIEPYR